MYSSGGKLKKGESRLFYDLAPDHTHVAVVGLGPTQVDTPPNQDVHLEDIDVEAQSVREAAAAGTKLLQKARVKEILLDDFNNAEGMEGTPDTIMLVLYVNRGTS